MSGATDANTIPETMQAVVCHGPENYQLETVAVPRPGSRSAVSA